MAKKKNVAPVQEKAAPVRKVVHNGYTAVQSTRNNHIMIGKDGKMVYHAQCDHALTEAELREVIDDYLVLKKVVFE